MDMKEIFYRTVKRIFDIIASALGLIVLSPVFIAAMAGILLSDPGPVFYISDRAGRNNKRFRMIKFRSMRVDDGADERSLRPDQSRIFKWGQVMRDTKIDEIPQLVNVLCGDMSFIGPRPASVDQTEITRGGKYKAVGKATPGLSGPSALYDYIYGDKITDEEEYNRLVLKTRLDLDLFYLKVRSLNFDARMIVWTLKAIFMKNRTEPMLAQLEEWAGTMEE